MSYGVFQNFYYENEPFRGNKNISVVGTIATAITYMGALFTTPLVKKYQRYQRHMIWVGWVICILSLIAGSFANQIETLILTQGIMYGLGELMLFYPILSMITEWFEQKRGLAFGILSCATGVTGIFFPFIIEVLLVKYGYAITLRAIAVGLAVLTGPFLPRLRVPLGERIGLLSRSRSFMCMLPQIYAMPWATGIRRYICRPMLHPSLLVRQLAHYCLHFSALLR